MTPEVFKKKLLPHIVVIVGFFLVTAMFFSPTFFGGKALSQGDIVAHKGASKELVDHRSSQGEEALWTNSMFGGMPAYQISTTHPSNFVKQLERLTYTIVPHPYVYLFLAFVCFYGLMLILKVQPLLAVVGALAFGLSSYNIQLYEAGHNTKIAAIAYMPMVLGAVILVFRKKYLLGGALFAFFLCLELGSNHVQITYYLALLLLFVVLFLTVKAIEEDGVSHVLKTASTFLVGALFALACNASLLWTTYEYKDDTIRGKSELQQTNQQQDATTGLDKSYITQWSYGKTETFSLLVPNMKGGGSGVLKEEKHALKSVKKKYRKTVQGMDKYFGGQPFTSGPVYLGAVLCLLLFIGLVFYQGPLKWPLLVGSVLAVLLSWGKNFMGFTDFFIENIPLYNNFRAVSMTLVIVQLAAPVLAMLGLQQLLSKEQDEKSKKKVLYSGGVLVLLLLIFMAVPTTVNDFFKPGDPLLENPVGEQEELTNELKKYNWPTKQITALLDNLAAARKEVFLSDVKRSLMFVILGWIVVLLFVHKKIQKEYAISALLVLVLADLWSVDKRYLSEENFQKKKKTEEPFVESSADRYIVSQPDNGRVLNLAVNTFNDASTSYLHQSIGGYSAVKLRRYQELFEYSLNTAFNNIKTKLSTGDVNNLFEQTPTLNMLNLKYLIYNPNAAPLFNEKAYGKAWLASSALLAENADQELDLTLKTTSKKEVVISEQEKGNVKSTRFLVDSSSSVVMTNYLPNDLSYQAKLTNKSLVVFSEIFYKKGWIATIDGQEVPIARANYVLRALEVPAGEHEIRFQFQPTSYYLGSKISGISSAIIILVLLWLSVKQLKVKAAG